MNAKREAQLLAAVLARPGDDLRRTTLADHWRATGRAREADALAAQLAHAAAPDDPQALAAAQASLPTDLYGEWRELIGPRADAYQIRATWSRGLVETLSVSSAQPAPQPAAAIVPLLKVWAPAVRRLQVRGLTLQPDDLTGWDGLVGLALTRCEGVIRALEGLGPVGRGRLRELEVQPLGTLPDLAWYARQLAGGALEQLAVQLPSGAADGAALDQLPRLRRLEATGPSTLSLPGDALPLDALSFSGQGPLRGVPAGLARLRLPGGAETTGDAPGLRQFAGRGDRATVDWLTRQPALTDVELVLSGALSAGWSDLLPRLRSLSVEVVGGAIDRLAAPLEGAHALGAFALTAPPGSLDALGRALAGRPLRSLSLRCTGDPERATSLAPLRRLARGLEALRIAGGPYADLEMLATLGALRTLALDGCHPLTDAHLVAVSELDLRLLRVHQHAAPVAHGGGADALEALATSTIERLELDRSAISPEGLAWLAEQRPDLPVRITNAWHPDAADSAPRWPCHLKPVVGSIRWPEGWACRPSVSL